MAKANKAENERNNMIEKYPLKTHLIIANKLFFLPFSQFLRSTMFKQLNHSAMLINISVIEAL